MGTGGQSGGPRGGGGTVTAADAAKKLPLAQAAWDDTFSARTDMISLSAQIEDERLFTNRPLGSAFTQRLSDMTDKLDRVVGTLGRLGGPNGPDARTAARLKRVLDRIDTVLSNRPRLGGTPTPETRLALSRYYARRAAPLVRRVDALIGGPNPRYGAVMGLIVRRLGAARRALGIRGRRR